jgi:hypothetical protein
MDKIKDAQIINRIIENIVENKGYDQDFNVKPYSDFENEILIAFLNIENDNNVLNFITESKDIDNFIDSIRKGLMGYKILETSTDIFANLLCMLRNYYKKDIRESIERYIEIMNEEDRSCMRGYDE